MTDCITMIKYQGLGNDYLVLDPNKNRVQLQGKKIALMCQRGFGLGADGVLIARPYVTAVYGGGEEGVKALTDKLAGELASTMKMCGVSSLKEITKDCLFKPSSSYVAF